VKSAVCASALLACLWGAAVAGPVDVILRNGKVVTVDDRFTIAQAIAIRGERVLATGTDDEIGKLASAQTRVIDLRGRTVIPGLIDNHAHFMRAAEYWHREVRLDGVTSRKLALDMIAAKAKASAPGEWVLALGGWSLEQFADSHAGFTRAELDAAAPDNPVALQLIYFRIYTNGAGLKALGIDRATPDPRGGKIEKDAAGEPTGELNGAGAVRGTLAKLGEIAMERMTANARALLADLNRVGITSFIDMGGRGFREKYFEPFEALHRSNALTTRVFYYTWYEPETAEQVDAVVAKIRQMKPFQGDDRFDQVGYGETVFFPLHDSLLAATAKPSAEGLAQWRRIAQAVAEQGMALHVHAQLRGSIDAFLTEIEAINKVRPIKGLRWSFAHADQLEAKDLDRLRRLGMAVQIHSRPTIQGQLMMKVHGERAFTMPPMRLLQESGIPWGLGSDATAVTPTNPFYTLWFAVSGKMLGDGVVNRETITREQALIAHTRSNAYFMFQEANLGSLAPGKYADLVVLDRDYFSVPVDDIPDIKPAMTMVGGKAVYDALH
jgi:predicted amidohydrolase YtcJ